MFSIRIDPIGTDDRLVWVECGTQRGPAHAHVQRDPVTFEYPFEDRPLEVAKGDEPHKNLQGDRPTGGVDRGYLMNRSWILIGVSVGSLPGEDVGGQVGERPVQDRAGLTEESVEGGGPIGSEVGPGGPPVDRLGQGAPAAAA